MTKKLISLIAVLMLCLSCLSFASGEAAPAATAAPKLPSMEEIYAANNFDSWNTLYTMRICAITAYDVNSLMADVARELTFCGPDGKFAFLYGDTDGHISFFY